MLMFVEVWRLFTLVLIPERNEVLSELKKSLKALNDKDLFQGLRVCM